MRALVYGAAAGDEPRAPRSDVDRALVAHLLAQPVRLCALEDPTVDADDVVVLAPRLAGVCGSDARLMLGDLNDGDLDNPMASFSALPFVLGHEVVADVVAAGSASGAAEGDRVVLNAWLSCAPRGFDACPACAAGDLAQCERFLDGAIGPGLHVGVTEGAPGAFATLLRAHASQVHAVPAGVSDEAAVLADPFSVSLHAIARTPPPKGGRVLVIGAGALGTTAVAALRRWHPSASIAVLCPYGHLREVVTAL